MKDNNSRTYDICIIYYTDAIVSFRKFPRSFLINSSLFYCIYFCIECFTTTFLHTHSWLNWVDENDAEDEVGLKEKPEDTRYVKKITSK